MTFCNYYKFDSESLFIRVCMRAVQALVCQARRKQLQIGGGGGAHIIFF